MEVVKRKGFIERYVEAARSLRFSMVGIQVSKIKKKKTAAPTCKVRYCVSFVSMPNFQLFG